MSLAVVLWDIETCDFGQYPEHEQYYRYDAAIKMLSDHIYTTLGFREAEIRMYFHPDTTTLTYDEMHQLQENNRAWFIFAGWERKAFVIKRMMIDIAFQSFNYGHLRRKACFVLSGSFLFDHPLTGLSRSRFETYLCYPEEDWNLDLQPIVFGNIVNAIYTWPL